MEQKNDLPYFLLLFFISPVLALLSGMVNFRKRNGKLIVILFVGLFGFTLIQTPGKDSYSHYINFAEFFQHINATEFVGELQSVAAFEGSSTNSDEPYLIILSYLLAQFTDNPAWLFLAAGLIYGFFFINGISLVYSEKQRNWNIVLIILFVFFVSWKGIEGINAIRNWTGAWVFFNGAYLYLKTEDKKYILLVLAAPLFHFGYLIITMPFYIYYLTGDRRYVYLALLIVSYFFSASISFLEPYFNMTELGETKLESYTGERFERERETRFEGSFHAAYYTIASQIAIQTIFLYSLIFMGYLKGVNHDRFQFSLGSLSILLLVFANFTASIPVLNNRIFVNFGLYALAYVIRLYSSMEQPSQGFHYVVYATAPLIFLFLFTGYSMIGDFMDFRILFSPLMYPFLGDDPVSMKNFIRQLLGV